MASLGQDMGILSKSFGAGGAGVYAPAKYEYAMNQAPGLRGGRKSRKARRKSRKVSKSRKVRRTARKGVLEKAKSALRKMFRF